MKKKKNQGLFWASYTDLMTSLFFVMLVLYMLTYILLEKEKEKFKADAEKYQKIVAMEAAVKNLEKEESFVYDTKYKRLLMTENIQFERDVSNLPNADKPYLRKIGAEINAFLNQQVNDEDVRYLVIVEGMASKDKAEDSHNYSLSYQRAYSLFQFWKDNNIVEFNDEKNEILIAGSGIGGVGRELDEKKNQRFLIQIIPKINAK